MIISHRDNSNKTAVIFIHGFGGDPKKTWNMFPEILAENQSLKNWDIFSLGYTTGLLFDVTNIWRADPAIPTIADWLKTISSQAPINRYDSIVFIAHSMGGLALQMAMVDDRNFAGRVGHAFFFGTPSGGILKASIFKFWKRSLEDMSEGGSFIKNLREKWEDNFIKKKAPFKYLVVAGDQDEFVPRTSSIDPFPDELRRVIIGNHLSIVKPDSVNDGAASLVISTLTNGAAKSGEWDSAKIAIEQRNFHKVIEQLFKNKETLDEKALVDLALALEGVGRQPEAIEILQRVRPDYTDAIGVLAGRLKRRWLVERKAEDADNSRKYYSEAYNRSVEGKRYEQAYYHGINIAFLDFMYANDLIKAREMAEEVLKHCETSERNPETHENKKWRLATEGEAYLYLGKMPIAIDRYQKAINQNPTPRQMDSMYSQATRVLSQVGDPETAERLEGIFRPC